MEEMWTPDVTSTISGVLEWFNPWVEMLWPWAKIAIGIILIFGVIGFIITAFWRAGQSMRH